MRKMNIIRDGGEMRRSLSKPVSRCSGEDYSRFEQSRTMRTVLSCPDYRQALAAH